MQLDYRNLTPLTFTTYILALAENQRIYLRTMGRRLRDDMMKHLKAFADKEGIYLGEELLAYVPKKAPRKKAPQAEAGTMAEAPEKAARKKEAATAEAPKKASRKKAAATAEAPKKAAARPRGAKARAEG